MGMTVAGCMTSHAANITARPVIADPQQRVRFVSGLEKEAGNGGQEIRNWIAVLGALPDRKGEVLAYEPVPEWLAGCGAVWMEP